MDVDSDDFMQELKAALHENGAGELIEFGMVHNGSTEVYNPLTPNGAPNQ